MEFINMKDTDQRKHSRKLFNHRFYPQKILAGRAKGLFLKLDAENLSRRFSSFDALDVWLAQASHKVIISFTLREMWMESRDASSSKSLLYDCYLWRKQLLYSCAHCADCELRLIGHDVSGLDVTVVHRVLERSPSISVLMAHVTIEGDFGSSSGMRQITIIRAAG